LIVRRSAAALWTWTAAPAKAAASVDDDADHPAVQAGDDDALAAALASFTSR